MTAAVYAVAVPVAVLVLAVLVLAALAVAEGRHQLSPEDVEALETIAARRAARQSGGEQRG